jgi:hypothetical protein
MLEARAFFAKLMLSSRPQTNTTTLFVEEKNYVETHARTQTNPLHTKSMESHRF